MPARTKILAISHDPALVRFLQRELDADGYDIVSALPDSDHLRLTLDTERPDFIVVDIGMPALDGIGMTLQLRQWTPRPIIMLSTYNTSEGKIRGLDLGSDSYLTEPFGGDVLQERIEAIMNRQDGVSA
jgi:DNA-binding response OmpR family regulator